MRYCLNCNQNVIPKKIIDTGTKVSSSIIGGIFFFLFISFIVDSISPFSYGLGSYYLGITIICLLISIMIIFNTYYTSLKSCPICEFDNWNITKKI